MPDVNDLLELINALDPECAKRLIEAMLKAAAYALAECEEEDFPTIPGRPVTYDAAEYLEN